MKPMRLSPWHFCNFCGLPSFFRARWVFRLVDMPLLPLRAGQMSWVLLENEVGLLGGRSDWCRRIQAEVSNDERRRKKQQLRGKFSRFLFGSVHVCSIYDLVSFSTPCWNHCYMMVNMYISCMDSYWYHIWYITQTRQPKNCLDSKMVEPQNVSKTRTLR